MSRWSCAAKTTAKQIIDYIYPAGMTAEKTALIPTRISRANSHCPVVAQAYLRPIVEIPSE